MRDDLSELVTPDDAVPDDAVPDDVTPDDVTPDDVTPDDAAPDVPGRRRRPARWLAPAMVAVVLVTAFGVITAAGRNHRHPTAAAGGSTALGLWADFPVDASPRPLVLADPDLKNPARGFLDVRSMEAYDSRRLTLRTKLPVGPAMMNGQRVMSAAEALDQLVDPGAPRPAGPTLAVTAIRLGTAAFYTDRGIRMLPVWSFRFAGVPDPALVLAIPQADRWPRAGMPMIGGSTIEGATISGDGTKVTVMFIGAAPGTGPCEAEYAMDVRQSRTAVSVSARALPGRYSQAMCNADGHLRTLTVTLQPPLGNRVLVDPRGAVVPVPPPMPMAR